MLCVLCMLCFLGVCVVYLGLQKYSFITGVLIAALGIMEPLLLYNDLYRGRLQGDPMQYFWDLLILIILISMILGMRKDFQEPTAR